jgi:hypothetical protein
MLNSAHAFKRYHWYILALKKKFLVSFRMNGEKGEQSLHVTRITLGLSWVTFGYVTALHLKL